jgi:virginiamycin B lyase
MPEARDTPTAVAASADGTIWFTIDLAAAVGRIRDGQLERIAKEAASLEPIGIAADAGGGAWFTDVVAGAISHVSVDGTVTSVPINTPIVRLGRVAAAPDGGVWFAESSLQSVTLLKDGVLFRHPTGVPDGGPYGVAVGADGTVWATLQAGNALVRIAPSHEVEVLELPRPGAVPTDIAVGPDGSVWFIEFRANRIVRYRDGAFEGFAVPGANAGLSGLAVAPDGTVWFGMLREGSLGRLSGGRLQRLRLPRERARPYSVAVDAVGNIWYADITGHVGMVPSDTR